MRNLSQLLLVVVLISNGPISINANTTRTVYFEMVYIEVAHQPSSILFPFELEADSDAFCYVPVSFAILEKHQSWETAQLQSGSCCVNGSIGVPPGAAQSILFSESRDGPGWHTFSGVTGLWETSYADDSDSFCEPAKNEPRAQEGSFTLLVRDQSTFGGVTSGSYTVAVGQGNRGVSAEQGNAEATAEDSTEDSAAESHSCAQTVNPPDIHTQTQNQALGKVSNPDFCTVATGAVGLNGENHWSRLDTGTALGTTPDVTDGVSAAGPFLPMFGRPVGTKSVKS